MNNTEGSISTVAVAIPSHPLNRTSAIFPLPTDCPTRAMTALEIPTATIKITVAKFITN